MPALLTHYLCGESMLKLMDSCQIKRSILKYRSAFNLGTQGPDVFFYYRAWPWTKSKGIPKFGDRMHEEKTGEFMAEALKYTAASDGPSIEILTAYMCGYLCHYSLDCHTHPYIFYRTGFVLDGEEYTSKYTCYHRSFETALDVLMLKHLHGKKPAEINPSDYIKVSKAVSEAIGEMLETVIRTVYNTKLPKAEVCQAIHDMPLITAALRDRYGIKKKLLSRLERSQGKYPLMSSMILPQEINDGRDYLNISRSVWHLPWDASASLTVSFPEMFEAAAQEAKYLCSSIASSKISQLVGNRSFTTGEDCGLDLKFKYFDCVFEGKI